MTNPNENPSAKNTGASNNHIPSQHVEQDISPLNNTKQCKTCLERKPVTEFAKNTKTQDGYLHTCLACVAANKRPSQSLRQAINAKCTECIYDPLAGGGSWREQVTACTSGGCPLHDVRPTTRGAS
tara:strand:- start:3742 stop:4119 length:378 start_codon:yes stop_codon:yes gene_type:complete